MKKQQETTQIPIRRSLRPILGSPIMFETDEISLSLNRTVQDVLMMA